VNNFELAIKENTKYLKSDTYNYMFRYSDGYFLRWGETPKDDPEFSPYGPEIADIEVSTICHRGCKFCYKANTGVGENMSFETFKTVFHKLPKTLTQIAFGIGSFSAIQPELEKMFEYCRNNDYNIVIPNLTINGKDMEAEDYDLVAKYCGACSVSRYAPYNDCYTAIKELRQRGMKQVNIHQVLAKETFQECIQLLVDYKENKDGLKDNVNAIVFLALKEKGRATGEEGWHSLKDTFLMKALLDFAVSNKLNIGFDSCNGPTILKIAQEDQKFKNLIPCIDPCESLRFSIYINVVGIAEKRV
jgi:hypothetical protein